MKFSAKKIRELLETKRVYNQWDFSGSGGVFITRVPSAKWQIPCWSVQRIGYKIGPKYTFGKETIQDRTYDVSLYAKDDKVAFNEAIEWASMRYNVSRWVKSPFGDWMPKANYEKRMAELLPEVELKTLHEVVWKGQS